MIRLILLITFLVSCMITLAQSEKENLPPKRMTKRMQVIEYKNHECIHKAKYSLEQRLTFYPFSHAAQIKLVSFDNRPDTNGYVVIGSNTIPMIADKVDYSKIDEVVALTNKQVDSLTDILYNTGYSGRIMIISGTGCYNPRNAILFIDSTGNTFAFIELCFECGGHRESSDKVQAGEFCNDKYEILKDYFKNAGIEIGTVRGIGFDLTERQ